MSDISDENRWVGKQVKAWLAENHKSREFLAENTKLGKGSIDKLCAGIYGQKVLDAVQSFTGLKLESLKALDQLGKYEKNNWIKYEGTYLMVEKSYPIDGSISVRRTELYWDSKLPGFAIDIGHIGGENVGVISIPHERSPVLYVKLFKSEGRYIVLSTMFGEKIMRGLKLSVQRVVANAYVPTVTPIAFIGTNNILDENFPLDCAITSSDKNFSWLSKEMSKIEDEKYGIIL